MASSFARKAKANATDVSSRRRPSLAIPYARCAFVIYKHQEEASSILESLEIARIAFVRVFLCLPEILLLRRHA